MPKKPVHIDLSLNLIQPYQLREIKIHKNISDLIPAINVGFELLISSLNSRRQPSLSETNPLIIWDHGNGKQTLIRGILYYYESKYNNVPVYANVRSFTPTQAEKIASDEVVMKPLGYQCALGKRMKIARKARKPGKPTATSDLTAFSNELLLALFGTSNSLDFHLNTKALATSNRVSDILHVSPETVCRYLADLGLRKRHLQRRPKPPNDDQKSMF